jgi:hypothetical protein
VSDQDQFWATGPGRQDEGDIRGGRYQWPDPDTGEARSWQRASNLAYPLIDQEGLQKWRIRQLLIGLSQRRDLTTMLAAMTDPVGDVTKLDEIAKTALEVAGTTASANLGTAVHEVIRAYNMTFVQSPNDAQLVPSPPEELRTHLVAYTAELRRLGLTPMAAELNVISKTFGTAGRLDVIFTEADGTLVLGDVKTTNNPDRAAHQTAVQLAGCYASATHFQTPTGRWQPIDQDGQVRQDYALMIHIDRDSGAVAVYRVELHVGRQGTVLAEMLRGWRYSGPVLLPYVPPVAVSTAVDQPVDRTEQASDEAALYMRAFPSPDDQNEAPAPDPFARISGAGPALVVDDSIGALPRHDPMELADGSLVSQPPAVGGGGAAVNGTDRGATGGSSLRSAEDLMRPKVSKAEVQQYCRAHGITDLAHTKKVLVEMLERAGKLAPGLPVSVVDHGPARTPRLGDPAEIAADHPGLAPTTTPTNGAGEDPTDPRSPAFRLAALDALSRADTVADLGRVRHHVVRLGGDQAWTDELAQAARGRAAQIEPAGPNPSTVLARIGACDSPAALSDLWEEVTVGGSIPGAWSGQMTEAGNARLAQLQAAAPPAPANPFVQS